MNKAFVREPDGAAAPEELSDRPVSPHPGASDAEILEIG